MGIEVLGLPFFDLLCQVVASLILSNLLDRLLHLGTLWVELWLHLDMYTPLLENQW